MTVSFVVTQSSKWWPTGNIWVRNPQAPLQGSTLFWYHWGNHGRAVWTERKRHGTIGGHCRGGTGNTLRHRNSRLVSSWSDVDLGEIRLWQDRCTRNRLRLFWNMLCGSLQELLYPQTEARFSIAHCHRNHHPKLAYSKDGSSNSREEKHDTSIHPRCYILFPSGFKLRSWNGAFSRYESIRNLIVLSTKLYDWHIGWSLSRLGWPALIAMENYGWWIECQHLGSRGLRTTLTRCIQLHPHSLLLGCSAVRTQATPYVS
jgi:hypothetical protein